MDTLVRPSLQFPIPLFSLLHDETDAKVEELSSVSSCMLDSFSRSFLKEHRRDGLCSDEALARLRSLAFLVCPQTAAIEQGRSRVRRQIVSHSVQTHVPAF